MNQSAGGGGNMEDNVNDNFDLPAEIDINLGQLRGGPFDYGNITIDTLHADMKRVMKVMKTPVTVRVKSHHMTVQGCHVMDIHCEIETSEMLAVAGIEPRAPGLTLMNKQAYFRRKSSPPNVQ